MGVRRFTGSRALVCAALAQAAMLGVSAAAAAVETVPLGGDILLLAEAIDYDGAGGTIAARGRVELAYGARVLTADRLIYDERTRVVTAEGRVAILEPTGEVVFAERVVLTEDLADGVVEGFALLFDERSRLVAASGERRAGFYNRLNKAVFSACETCADDRTPLWQVKADRVSYDERAGRVAYEDAVFEIEGVPVFWLPAFSHSDPTVRRQTGFLAPDIGTSTDLGFFWSQPFFWSIAPNMDATITSLFTEDAGAGLGLEFRHATGRGRYELAGAFAYAEKRDRFGVETGEWEVDSHLAGYGRFSLRRGWTAGFDIDLVSDVTYLKRYDISNRDRLTNRAFVEALRGRSRFSAEGFFFQGLRDTDDIGTTPIVLPWVEYSFVPRWNPLGGRLRIDGSFLSLYRTDGTDTRRAIAQAEWQRQVYTSLGHAVTFSASVRGDLYHVDDLDDPLIPGFDDEDDVVIGRVLPLAMADIRWPFVRRSGSWRQVVEPIAQFILAPYGGNPGDLPNEDSASFTFDETNLFEPLKLPGYDLWEEGPRANLGIRLASYSRGGRSIDFLIGQTFRLRDEPDFPAGAGIGDQRSDIVGRLAIDFAPWLSLTHRFRLDKDDGTVRRNEVYVQSRTGLFEFDAAYVDLQPEEPGLDPREEVSAAGLIRITDHWSLFGSARRDLGEDEMVESRFGISYIDECTEVSLGYRRRFTRDRDIEPSTALVLQIRLIALGGDGD